MLNLIKNKYFNFIETGYIIRVITYKDKKDNIEYLKLFFIFKLFACVYFNYLFFINKRNNINYQVVSASRLLRLKNKKEKDLSKELREEINLIWKKE